MPQGYVKVLEVEQRTREAHPLTVGAVSHRALFHESGHSPFLWKSARWGHRAHSQTDALRVRFLADFDEALPPVGLLLISSFCPTSTFAGTRNHRSYSRRFISTVVPNSP